MTIWLTYLGWRLSRNFNQKTLGNKTDQIPLQIIDEPLQARQPLVGSFQKRKRVCIGVLRSILIDPMKKAN